MRHSLASLRIPGPFPALSLVVVCAVAIGTYVLGHRVGQSAPVLAPVAESLHGDAPRAPEFARQLTGLANQFAAEAGENARLAKVDCVEGAHRGHYMCSFALLRTSRPAECRLIQAIWTPMEIDSFKVTLSGRAGRCGTLREAIQSLQ